MGLSRPCANDWLSTERKPTLVTALRPGKISAKNRSAAPNNPRRSRIYTIVP